MQEDALAAAVSAVSRTLVVEEVVFLIKAFLVRVARFGFPVSLARFAWFLQISASSTFFVAASHIVSLRTLSKEADYWVSFACFNFEGMYPCWQAHTNTHICLEDKQDM